MDIGSILKLITGGGEVANGVGNGVSGDGGFGDIFNAAKEVEHVVAGDASYVAKDLGNLI
jgi:hypothetical protein